MAQHLKEFPQLEHLDIQLCNNVDLHRIDDLLEICPGSLKKISVLFRTIFEETPSVKQFDPKSSTRLHNIKLFELENNGPLNDEDLIYMMHRFPALQKISIYREEENCSTPTAKLGPQSADVICKFLQYLGNIPEVMLHDLKVAPDVMCTVIIKLSKYWRVNELETCGLPEWRDDSFAYFLADKKPNPSTSFAIKLELPSFGINPLYHVALKALSGQLTKLGVRGTLDEDQLLLEDHSVTEMAKSDIYNELLGRILDSTTRIKDIQLQALLINKLPASMATSVEKMQLNSLEINNCVFFPQMLNQLSQRLSFVKRFTFNNIATVSGNPSSGECKQETNIHMPYTAFDKICANYTGFVILLTLSTDTMTRYYACTGPELLEQVSKEEYSQMKNTTDGVPSINIICRDCNAITVFGGMGFGGNEVVLH
ncbi:hypothetical protein FB192DRAFT_1048091 [Mucor lusitanicus]|nr:hypothetical protein FB192DRAFT_1048091 [Mucor lusitanicus]